MGKKVYALIVMARNNDAIRRLEQDDNVIVSEENDRGVQAFSVYVYPEATTDGPALDPVEVWDAHQHEYAVLHIGRASDGSEVYAVYEKLNEVEG